jgi:hypothetical protein
VSGADFFCPRCGAPAMLEPAADGRFLKPDRSLVGMDCEERRNRWQLALPTEAPCPILMHEADRLRKLTGS